MRASNQASFRRVLVVPIRRLCIRPSRLAAGRSSAGSHRPSRRPAGGQVYGRMLSLIGAVMLAAAWRAQDGALLEPWHVITLTEIEEVRLAADGSHVAYALRARHIHENRVIRSFWLVSTRDGSAVSLPLDPDASNLRWRPHSGAVTYLAPDRNGVAQVWEYTADRPAQQLTSRTEPISSYEWSPDGRNVAFTASVKLASNDTTSAAGVVVNRDRFFHWRLLDNEPLARRDAHYGDPQMRMELWIQNFRADRAQLASGELLSVSGYAWSPNGRMLAITAHGELGRLPKHLARHDLFLYTVNDGELQMLQAGGGGDYLDDTVIYDQPFWSPDGSRIGYFRRDLRDRWASSPQLGVFSLRQQRTTFFLSDIELETYEPRGLWLHPDTILLENTYQAGRRLFAVALPDGSVEPIVDSGDWFDQHHFSRDGEVVAFTRQRIDKPAELYIADRSMREPRQLTDLHGSVATLSPRVERLRWSGEAGIDVEGWLFLPPGEPPFPTIVFVHGGPTWVYSNRYEPYVRYWPHALGVYAARGIAVFAPNYRGTASYGKAFRQASALDAEPVDDIIAGLDVIVAKGIADPDRLGLAGHSHGCWLGSLVAVRHRRFAVAACAEGPANWTSAYGRRAGWMNSEFMEYYLGGGASPYAEPERYRGLSPVYEFEGLRTPFLIEAGELVGALGGLEFATAAWRASVPHEFVLYRDTGHNVAEPRVMLEVMERNLEWFEFWLLGREQPRASKSAQYKRWRELKDGTVRGAG